MNKNLKAICYILAVNFLNVLIVAMKYGGIINYIALVIMIVAIAIFAADEVSRQNIE